MDRDHELSAVLADDTRYHIYRWIAERPGTTSPSPTSPAEFGLHPNVARMHLAKLEQAGFLDHRLPPRGRWRPAGEAVPAERHGRHLRVPAAPLRAALAARARRALGRRHARRRAARVPRGRRRRGPPRARRRRRAAARPRAAASALVAQHRRGAGPAARRWRGGTASLSVVVNNCSFRELSGADPDLVCAMHRAFLEGILQVVTAGLGTPAHRPGRLPHQLRRRALRDAVLLRIGRGVREARSRVVYGRTRTDGGRPDHRRSHPRSARRLDRHHVGRRASTRPATVLAAGPGAAGERAAEADRLLWDAAEPPRRAARRGRARPRRRAAAPTASSPSVEAHGHRAVAVTGPRPAVALLLFDLRTCLGDAFAGGEEAQ